MKLNSICGVNHSNLVIYPFLNVFFSKPCHFDASILMELTWNFANILQNMEVFIEVVNVYQNLHVLHAKYCKPTFLYAFKTAYHLHGRTHTFRAN